MVSVKLLGEALLATAVCALALALDPWLASVINWSAGLLPMLAMAGWPLWRTRHDSGDPLALGAPSGRAVRRTLLVGALTALVFWPGFSLVARELWGAGAPRWENLLRAPATWHGEPARPPPGVVLVDAAGRLQIHNNTRNDVQIAPTCIQNVACRPVVLRPGGRLELSAVQQLAVHAMDGELLPAGALVAGAEAVPLDNPTPVPRSLGWLAGLALLQVLGVALPEELLFRGWMLPKLIAAFSRTSRPQLWATVTAAALFALVHLVDQPSPHRLLVFFPGVLFGWLRLRTVGVGRRAIPRVVQPVAYRRANLSQCVTPSWFLKKDSWLRR